MFFQLIFLGIEILKLNRAQSSLMVNYPWIISFLYGLIHGLGFAGVLSSVGIASSELPMALVFFNLGIEIGQLCFVLVALIAFKIIRKLWQQSLLKLRLFLAYGIGTIGMYWFLQRMSMMI